MKEKDEHRTSNVQHRTSNEKIKQKVEGQEQGAEGGGQKGKQQDGWMIRMTPCRRDDSLREGYTYKPT